VKTSCLIDEKYRYEVFQPDIQKQGCALQPNKHASERPRAAQLMDGELGIATLLRMPDNLTSSTGLELYMSLSCDGAVPMLCPALAPWPCMRRGHWQASHRHWQSSERRAVSACVLHSRFDSAQHPVSCIITLARGCWVMRTLRMCAVPHEYTTVCSGSSA
jgi:hypothetical protein